MYVQVPGGAGGDAGQHCSQVQDQRTTQVGSRCDPYGIGASDADPDTVAAGSNTVNRLCLLQKGLTLVKLVPVHTVKKSICHKLIRKAYCNIFLKRFSLKFYFNCYPVPVPVQ